MKILVIEDELKLAKFICAALEQAGHVCEHSADGAKGLEKVLVNTYDLVLLDLMLPSMSGFDILKNIQDFKNTTPILVLSALNDTDNVIKGLDMGALDYLKKPFELNELLARIRAIQRRSLGQASNKIQVQDLEIDLLTRNVKRAGAAINLSNREFALLEFLISNANRVVTKMQILEKVWDIDFDPGSNVVEVHLYQLRKKIDKAFDPPLIHTLIGRGYMLKGTLDKK